MGDPETSRSSGSSDAGLTRSLSHAQP
jgi:hypothetical protein